MHVSMTKRIAGATLAVAVLAFSGCTAQKAFHTAEQESRRENWDQAVLQYSKAAALDPGNSRYSASDDIDRKNVGTLGSRGPIRTVTRWPIRSWFAM